ncbi:MAG: ATP-binding protein [Elusimicrobiota bacterium]
MFERFLNPSLSNSFFLFGPRQTGKSTLVKAFLKPHDLYFDLLPERIYLSYAKHPGRFRDEVLSQHQKHPSSICVVDEIQKLPSLLDEVHSLIESHKIRFILTGSSTRKLKRGASNLLAGRAYTYHLFPLMFSELGLAFNLDRALRLGTLPTIWNNPSEDASEFLRSYANTYLKEEIREEGLVKDIGVFSSFLDLVAAQDSEIVNFSAISRECGISIKTVQQYYQLLEDTFLGFRLPAWTKSVRHRMVSHPRFYLFDPGITNALSHQLGGELNSVVRGRRFEQFVILQLKAQLEYSRKDIQMYYWKTHSGFEVDLILAQGAKMIAALEVKSSASVSSIDIQGLKAFSALYPDVPCYVLSTLERERLIDGISAVKWDQFIQRFTMETKI